MNNLHPFRTRSILYLCTLVGLIAVCVIPGIAANSYKQGTRTYTGLATLSGITLVLFLIYLIPFLIYATRYWKLKTEQVTLPPADNQLHTVNVRYSTSILAVFFNHVFSPHGTLNWVNGEGIIRLVKSNDQAASPVFETHYQDIQQFSLDINMMKLKVNGKKYNIVPYSAATGASTLLGELMGNQMATMALEAGIFRQAGAFELSERLRVVGVKVTSTNFKKSVEHGFVYSFAIFMAATIILVAFIAH